MKGQNCPICGKNAVSLMTKVAAVFRSPARCNSCGAGLKSGPVHLILDSISFVLIFVVLVLMLTGNSWIPYFLVFLVILMGYYLMPLAPDPTDPITRSKRTRAKLRASRVHGKGDAV